MPGQSWVAVGDQENWEKGLDPFSLFKEERLHERAFS